MPPTAYQRTDAHSLRLLLRAILLLLLPCRPHAHHVIYRSYGSSEYNSGTLLSVVQYVFLQWTFLYNQDTALTFQSRNGLRERVLTQHCVPFHSPHVTSRRIGKRRSLRDNQNVFQLPNYHLYSSPKMKTRSAEKNVNTVYHFADRLPTPRGNNTSWFRIQVRIRCICGIRWGC